MDEVGVLVVGGWSGGVSGVGGWNGGEGVLSEMAWLHNSNLLLRS